MNINPFQWLINLLNLLAEMNPFRKWVILVTEILILVILLLPASLFQSFSCETPPGIGRLSYQSTNGSFIDDQLIVIGMPDETTQVLNQVAIQLGLQAEAFRLVEDCDLSYLNTRKAPDSNSIVEQRKFVMRLYETPDNADVQAIIDRINGTPQAQARTLFADPNYLTQLSALAGDPCAADPSGGGGTGGGPYGDPGIPDTEAEIRAAKDGFMNQWAFGSQGINLLPSTGFTGREVRVGVFDTSPFRRPYPIFNRITIALPTPLQFHAWDYAGTTMANSHGLFVASLIHRIAPNASIQLIRVLNDNGCGDLWALNRALEDYKSRMSFWTGDLDETVINMSLGIRNIVEAEEQDVNTLQELIRSADAAGAIIIASAGNDSSDLTEPALDMQVPASYDLVFGVAATNSGRTLSCYSNKGDLAAPGGDSRFTETKPDGTTEEKCESRTDTWDQDPGPNGDPRCSDIATCEFGLISLGYTRDGPQFMYWVGTSFAAPMVSGMAALAYEEMEKRQVICLLQGGPSPTNPDPELGTGIIDISKLTNTAAVPLCP